MSNSTRDGRVSQRGDEAKGVRRRGHACSSAHSAPTQTHVAPHSTKASGLIKLMPFSSRSNFPVNSGHEPVRTSGAPAHTPDALSQCSAVHASRSAWHQS